MKMSAEQIKYTRKHKRYPTQWEARYFLDNTAKDGQVCSIVNVSRKGMGIIFHTDEEILVGTTIRVEVPSTQSSESISFRGTVRWVDRMEIDIIGGLELMNELSDVYLYKLNPSSG